VVWFQGGPGCSSLFGLFLENGPLRVDANLTVQYTDVSWTQFANMLWVEAPAGVGFSYSTQPWIATNNKTAIDNYAFLQGFMQQYPQYQNRDLWIAGESYGGIYVPTLTALVCSNSSSELYKQLTGITIGNPYLACDSLWATNKVISVQFNLLYWHGLVSFSTYQNWTSANCDANPSQKICSDILNQAENDIGFIYQQVVTPPLKDDELVEVESPLPSLDPDNLYQDFCTGNGSLSFSQGLLPSCAPLGNSLASYLNLANVQSAINAKPATWAVCSSTLQYIQSGDSMIPYFEQFFADKPSLKALIYSGDVDIMTIPFAYTQQCLSELSGKITREWGPWTVDGWTAGYWEVHEQFTYATLKGAGHEAPQYQPLDSFNMYLRFLTKGTLDTENERHLRAKAMQYRKSFAKYAASRQSARLHALRRGVSLY